MRRWLERVIPQGAIHDGLVLAAEGAVKALIAVAVFFLLRALLVRTLGALMLPLKARAAREGETSLARLRTLDGLSRSAVSYVLLLLVAITLLGELGVNITAILTGAGVAGLALGIGAQRLVRDVITGFFLLLEDQFRVGELVTLINPSGTLQINGRVEEMGMRITRMLDLTGKLVIISNGEIGTVLNHSRGPIIATVEIGLPLDADVGKAREAVEAIALPEELFAGPAEVRGVSALEAERMLLRVAAPAQPGKALEAELVLRQQVHAALKGAEEGAEPGAA